MKTSCKVGLRKKVISTYICLTYIYIGNKNIYILILILLLNTIFNTYNKKHYITIKLFYTYFNV